MLTTIFDGTVYDSGARFLFTDGSFASIDPYAEKYPWISPYAYCAGNPINLTDPDGNETYVTKNQNGTYTVIGGQLNKDLNIYVYAPDSNGELTKTDESIGVTTSSTSFFNADDLNGKGAWAVGSIIDPNDKAGEQFLNEIVGDTPTLFDDYIPNADSGKYNFKETNATDSPIEGINHYRGMPIGQTTDGQTIFSSARDIGNIAAGYVSAVHGISWGLSRVAFDIKQSIDVKKPEREKRSTRNAEKYGWRKGRSDTNPYQQVKNMARSVKNWIKNR